MSTFEGVHEPLAARDVLLGRTTHVRRIVPNKTRRMIGAWCFLDHFGPDDIVATGGMWVPPHPRTRTPACRPSPGCSRASGCTPTAWAPAS